MMPPPERAASRILSLDQSSAARVKASSVITSLNDVAKGLLSNSLDAGATRIEIILNYQRAQVTVEDNGEGIPANEFGQNGGLGTIHRKVFIIKDELAQC